MRDEMTAQTMKHDMEEILGSGCRELGLTLTETMKEQFNAYYDILVRTNEVMNLTAITEYRDVLQKHFLDSLCIAKVVQMKNISNFIDIGTGAGFPGLPVKILFPEIRAVLADSLQKRVGFLKEAAEVCGLKGVTALHGRAEDLARDAELRESFDLAVSRAVAQLPVLAEYALPFVRTGGCFTAYKSTNIDDEVEASSRALSLLGGEIGRKEVYCIPGTDIPRMLIRIEKTGRTPDKYPRKAGLPSKKPL